MFITTLCYIEKDEKYLMLLRNRKAKDMNKNKWIGVGGKLEEGESPEQCLLREVKEETGLTLTSYSFRGIITFVSDEWGTEYMFLYTADGFVGALMGEPVEKPDTVLSDDKNKMDDNSTCGFSNKSKCDVGDEIFKCPEGELKWIDKRDVPTLNIWEGDREFLKLLAEDAVPFSMRLEYKGDKLVGCDWSYL